MDTYNWTNGVYSLILSRLYIGQCLDVLYYAFFFNRLLYKFSGKFCFLSLKYCEMFNVVLIYKNDNLIIKVFNIVFVFIT